MRYVVFDIETTGLDVHNDRIVELAAVKVEDGVVVNEFEQLINPGVMIPQTVINIHGITNEMVMDALLPGVVLQQFMAFIDDADFIIGHNAARYDWPMIKSECARHFVKVPKVIVKDTIFSARKRVRHLRSYSLKSLCMHFNIVNETAHRAMSDVYATYRVYESLLALEK